MTMPATKQQMPLPNVWCPRKGHGLMQISTEARGGHQSGTIARYHCDRCGYHFRVTLMLGSKVILLPEWERQRRKLTPPSPRRIRWRINTMETFVRAKMVFQRGAEWPQDNLD